MDFQMTGDQLERVLKWKEIQNMKVAKMQGVEVAYYGASGGGFTYEFTPTGLGIAIVVRNGLTGDMIDVSDYYMW